jgi:hypothetical protein
MKIKVNLEKETVSIKGLTPVQFGLIEALLSHVRLGDGTEASEAAFEILSAIEDADDLDFFEHVEVSVGATTDGHVEGLDLYLDGPTLVACEEDEDYELGAADYEYGAQYEAPTGAWPFVVSADKTCNGCSDCDCDE